MADTILRTRFIPTHLPDEGFSFFQYAESICSTSVRNQAIPGKVPGPLRSIFSQMRRHGCTLLVEETLTQDGLWDEELEFMKSCAAHPISGTLSRKIVRLSFFRCDKEIIRAHFRADWRTGQCDKLSEFEIFNALAAQTREEPECCPCLGYVILHVDASPTDIRIVDCCVFEAVVRRFEPPQYRYYVHSEAEFGVNVAGHCFSVPGSYFAQQKSHVTCCSHTAAMVLLKHLYASMKLDCPYTYSNLNEFFGIGPWPRDISTHGIEKQALSEGIEKCLQSIGLRCFVMDTRTYMKRQTSLNLPVDEVTTADKVITACYYTIESGLPAILCFESKEDRESGKVQSPSAATAGADNHSKMHHALAVVGHTFEGNSWQGHRRGPAACIRRSPQEKYIPSHSWVDTLLVQDDHCGPYCSLPRPTLQQGLPYVILPTFPWSRADTEEPHADTPEYYEKNCGEHLRNGPITDVGGERELQPRIIHEVLNDNEEALNDIFWLRTVLGEIEACTSVLRTVPIMFSTYLKFIQEVLKLDEEQCRAVQGLLGGQDDSPVWLCEISVSELYQHSERRLGEVIIDPSREGGHERFLLIRLPGVLITEPRGTPPRFFRNNANMHYPLEPRSSAIWDYLRNHRP